ncbi:nucleobindin-2-like [Artemia franciscana]|uniref:nucleobindin-2-like n=1 Tax=Artemia franciscana TaxID=6661 RepID=UPI0032DBD717
MMVYVKLTLLFCLLSGIICPPVQETGNEIENELEQGLGLEYERYVKEVVQALESDPEFRKKLENSDPEDIKKGKISDDLDLVHHNVRTKLDELKRQEIERLRKLAIAEYEEKEGIHRPGGRLRIPGHIDHKNLQTFEKEDLRKLIIQTTKDLDDADKQRREDFKRYEMEKEFDHKRKLEQVDGEAKKKEEQEWEEKQKKHKDHPKLHHPGSKQQLEEVWEKEDHMAEEDWDPRTFFKLHDIDGNGVWDPNEVKALFRNELNKMYDPNAPEDDMRERMEEMERMREHVIRQTDKNRDGLISFEEFLEESQKSEFNEDPGWDTVDQGPIYNEEEYRMYEQRRIAEIQRMVQEGRLPPQPHLNLMPPQHMMAPQYGVPHMAPQYGMPQYEVPHNGTHYAVPQYGGPVMQQAQIPQYGAPMVQPGHLPQYVPPIVNPGHVPQYGVPQGQMPQYAPQYMQYNQTHYMVPANYLPQAAVPQQLPPRSDMPGQAKITPEEGDKLLAALPNQYQAIKEGQPNSQPSKPVVNAPLPIAADQVNPQPVPVSYQQGPSQSNQQPSIGKPQESRH